jgi:hypothetical protein
MTAGSFTKLQSQRSISEKSNEDDEDGIDGPGEPIAEADL